MKFNEYDILFRWLEKSMKLFHENDAFVPRLFQETCILDRLSETFQTSPFSLEAHISSTAIASKVYIYTYNKQKFVINIREVIYEKRDLNLFQLMRFLSVVGARARLREKQIKGRRVPGIRCDWQRHGAPGQI